MFTQVLHPTDFSRVALQAFEQALALAERFDAGLRVVHAMVLHGYDPQQIRRGLPLLEKAYKEIESELLQGMEEMTGKVKGVDVETVFRKGLSPGETILEEAEACRADLIVMGVHGAEPVRRFFLGSVADKVVRHAACPVLLAGRGKHPVGPYKKILFPVDFSHASKEASRLAVELARHDGAELSLLYVFQDVMPPAFYAAGDAFKSDPDMRERCETAMDEFLDGLGAGDLSIRKVCREGKPSQEIVEAAGEIESDVIIMGTRGLSGLPHILLGSTTERVLRRAPCPVLTVRDRDPDEG
ncbi:MAG: hypothetical protein GF355_00770 [Candidatus Eisenbacteria bacterium]|nr:hypothetical protein [Candidatus Eisenbacteria bacterium]